MSSFDPMAVAIDWLDAYRAADLDLLVGLYASDATLECGKTVIAGPEAIAAYWRDRFTKAAAGELEDLTAAGSDVVVSYRLPTGIGHTSISFDQVGKIRRCSCTVASRIIRSPTP
jgi:ketosteroid isomerase-like protein